MPAARPVIVELTPVPVLVVPPGVTVKVHVPDVGKPLKTTSPVATEQVGCVIVPIVGTPGAPGCALITTLAEAEEIQPDALVTV